jgi:hypothetical protein
MVYKANNHYLASTEMRLAWGIIWQARITVLADDQFSVNFFLKILKIIKPTKPSGLL